MSYCAVAPRSSLSSWSSTQRREWEQLPAARHSGSRARRAGAVLNDLSASSRTIQRGARVSGSAACSSSIVPFHAVVSVDCGSTRRSIGPPQMRLRVTAVPIVEWGERDGAKWRFLGTLFFSLAAVRPDDRPSVHSGPLLCAGFGRPSRLSDATLTRPHVELSSCSTVARFESASSNGSRRAGTACCLRSIGVSVTRCPLASECPRGRSVR